MRFDILDEYSTLVPSGRGVFQQNKVAQYPATATKAVKRSAIINSIRRLKTLFRFVKALGQMKGREAAG